MQRILGSAKLPGIPFLESGLICDFNDGFDLTFLSMPQSRHAQDLSANPQVAGTIHEDYPDWPDIKGVQIEGRVHRLSNSDSIEAVGRFADKFPVTRPRSAPASIQAALKRVAWYGLVTERCFFVDNSQGFGHRDEIPLG